MASDTVLWRSHLAELAEQRSASALIEHASLLGRILFKTGDGLADERTVIGHSDPHYSRLSRSSREARARTAFGMFVMPSSLAIPGPFCSTRRLHEASFPAERIGGLACVRLGFCGRAWRARICWNSRVRGLLI